VSAVVDIVVRSVLAAAAGGLFFRSWHLGFDCRSFDT
jgi:hypothetical protein